MRVAIFSVGTQGDIRPFVALGQGLMRAGYGVRIATSDNFRPLITTAGLEFAPLTADFRDIMATEPEMMKDGLNPLTVAKTLRRRLKKFATSWAEEGRAAIQDVGLLIGSGIATHLAMSLAEVSGKPCVQAQLLPITPSPALPPILLTPPRRPWPGPVNLFLHHALRMLAWQTMKPAFNDVLRRQLGLPPYPWYGPQYEPDYIKRRTIYGFSRHVVPKPANWGCHRDLAGYWFYDDMPDWQPPAELVRFLAAGQQPIYVGFGSVLSSEAGAITEAVLQAVEQTGERAIFARGWGGLTEIPADLEGRVLVIDEAPHNWLFPRVSLAVHHAGAGTAAAAARAGIPTVAVPFDLDQPFWAWRLEQLGVAPAALPLRTLTGERLAAAIRLARSDVMRERARALGACIRAEDGVSAAIKTMTLWGLLPAYAQPAKSTQ